MKENYGPFPGGVRPPNPTERFFVCKTRSGRNLITLKPESEPKRGGTKHSMQEQVRQAVTYAEFAWDQPIYQTKAVGSSNSAYNLAVADFLGKPQILDIDLHGWTRKIGQSILIQAKDNFLVLSVRLVIREGDSILEQGEAEQSPLDALTWRYILQTSVERKPGLTLDAFASDLPGNVGSYSIALW
jgi:hypothetical protein